MLLKKIGCVAYRNVPPESANSLVFLIIVAVIQAAVFIIREIVNHETLFYRNFCCTLKLSSRRTYFVPKTESLSLLVLWPIYDSLSHIYGRNERENLELTKVFMKIEIISHYLMTMRIFNSLRKINTWFSISRKRNH